MTQGEILSDDLRRALRADAWHGPALMELLSGMHAEEAMQRPIPTAHSIWEIVLHVRSWANIAHRRIMGGQPEPFDGEDWPEVGGFTSEHWDECLASLAESFERLSELVVGMTDEELEQNAPKSHRSIGAMISGVSQHASYHGGQIAILRKLVTTHHRRTAL